MAPGRTQSRSRRLQTVYIVLTGATTPSGTLLKIQSSRVPVRAAVKTTPRTVLRTALALLVLAAAIAAVTAPAASAKGKTPCWKTLINDWYDGRIDRTYEVHCYKEALKKLPADVRTYSDAYDVISRALSDATHGKKDVKESSKVPPPPPPSNGGGGGGNSGGGSGGSGGGGNSGGGGTGKTGSGIQSDHSGGSVFGQATDKLGSDSADSLPIPLLVLAGLALLLVAAGGAGLLARRVQAKRTGGPRH